LASLPPPEHTRLTAIYRNNFTVANEMEPQNCRARFEDIKGKFKKPERKKDKKNEKMKVQTKKKYIQSASLIAAVLFLIICFFAVSKKASIEGTIRAIHSSLIMMINEEGFQADLYLTSPEEKWKKVSDSLYDELISTLNKKYEIDAPKKWSANKPLTDPWGNRFQIWYKSEQGSSAAFLVISCGPDGKAGTDDDIISDKDAIWP